MPSAINPNHPVDGVAVSKAEARANWTAAKAEIEALQDGKVDTGPEAHKITAMWRGTQAEYDAISSPDPSTLYVIVG